MEIEYTWTAPAAAVINREAPNGFNFPSTLPEGVGPVARGDVLSWDWLANGQRFIVMQRHLHWDDFQTCRVELLLDLPAG